jgi:glutamate-1-semialdehyde 2,1-aminomutase
MKKHGNQTAAIIMTPFGHPLHQKMQEPKPGFLEGVRKLADLYGAVLIFDEIVTGFRVALAGVQEYFGVTPDLAVFAKGIANGMPLAVYCGRAEIMDVCRPGGVIVSSTYGGETLSLAAAQAVMRVYQRENVVGHIWEKGKKMWDGLNTLFEKAGLPMRMKGLPPCPQLMVEGKNAGRLRERFMRASFRNGVSLYGVNYVNFSHGDSDIEEALERLMRAVNEVSKMEK